MLASVGVSSGLPARRTQSRSMSRVHALKATVQGTSWDQDDEEVTIKVPFPRGDVASVDFEIHPTRISLRAANDILIEVGCLPSPAHVSMWCEKEMESNVPHHREGRHGGIDPPYPLSFPS